MLGGFSDRVSSLLDYTLGGLVSLLRSSFLCDGKLDVSLPCRDDELFSYVLI